MKIENWKLEIIGTGPQEQQLKKLVNKYGLNDKIKFLNEQKDVSRFFPTWNVYIQPSISESFGLSIAEAMSCGIPIIATKTGGITELVDKNSGILVEPKNAIELASAIIKLATSEELRVGMGQSAFKRIIKHFSLNIMINKMEQLYTSLVLPNTK